MSWLIYKHTNRINGKVYIGQSKYTWEKINDRWQSGRGYGISTRIGLAIKKYGWENFSHDLIEEGIETAYRGSRDIDVMFEDGSIVEHREKKSFINGQISNKNLKK